MEGTSIVDRQVPMRRAAAILRERADEFARLMSDEMGKTIREGPGEIEKCAWVCEYYADHAEEFLARETVEAGGSRSFVTFNPLGVVLAIMPWNFPFWQVFRFAAPAVMAGNTALLKHSSNVPGCALAIEDVFRQAGFPEHVFRTLLMKTSMTADVIRDPRVAAVTLTGAPRRVRPSQRKQEVPSRRRFSSWAATMPTSFWRTRISSSPSRCA